MVYTIYPNRAGFFFFFFLCVHCGPGGGGGARPARRSIYICNREGISG